MSDLASRAEQSTATAALAIRGARLSFGDTVALDGLDLVAPVGEVTALLGPNGAGKTTLIRACTGLLDLDEGSISVLGRQVGDPDLASAVGLMPQNTGAWSGITGGELLTHLAALYAHPHSVTALTEALHLDSFLTTAYRRLSGGQKQAINLAGALIGRPRLVVLDEPTAGMDPHARRRTWSVIEQLRSAGVSVLLTTHDMAEAEALANQVHIINRGRVVVHGTIADLTAEQSLEEVFLSSTEDAR